MKQKKIPSFIVPRLERFIELYKEHINDEHSKLIPKTEELLYSFKNIENIDSDEKVQSGLEHFPKIFRGLWW